MISTVFLVDAFFGGIFSAFSQKNQPAAFEPFAGEYPAPPSEICPQSFLRQVCVKWLCIEDCESFHISDGV